MNEAEPRILITGFGLITPLGNGAWPTFRALLAGKRLTDRTAGVPADIASIDLVRSIGAINLAQHVADDPAIELAERAAREALAMANIQPNEDGLPCFIGTSKGAFNLFDTAASTFAQGGLTQLNKNKIYAQVLALGPHEFMSRALRNKIHLNTTHHTVAACASSLHALHAAKQFLLRNDARHNPTSNRSNKVSSRRALVVTSDASLTPLLISAYEKLGVLAPRTADTYRCNPLDKSRSGFVLAEAAAAVVLERVDEENILPRVDQRAASKQIELKETAIATDPFDLIRTSPTLDSLNNLHAKITTNQRPNLYHLHAPGTLDHDPAEIAMVHSQSGTVSCSEPENAFDIYAHKGALGHSLGASGLVATVIACLCQLTNSRPPMPWLTNPIHSSLARQSTIASPKTHTTIKNQAIFAAGFGGHAAGAVIGRPGTC
jgi:3-oxoacyl-[acyl-carrier-protein] synthase II